MAHKPPRFWAHGEGPVSPRDKDRMAASQAVMDELRPIFLDLLDRHGQVPTVEAIISSYITMVRMGDQEFRAAVADLLRLAADVVERPDDDLSVVAPQGKA